MLLPALVLGAQVKGARVLQVRRQHHGLVTSLSRQLDAEVPGIEGDKDKIEVLGREMLIDKGIEPIDGVAETAGGPNMLPGERGKARYGREGG
jgi:hypothetical protein